MRVGIDDSIARRGACGFPRLPCRFSVSQVLDSELLGLRGTRARIKLVSWPCRVNYDAHRRRLEELGAEVVLVKKPEQLDDIDGLVIPGGESGTSLKLLGEAGFEKLKQFARAKPTFGTRAGAILLASEVDNPKQAGLGVLDVGIRRNACGTNSTARSGKAGRRLTH